MTIQKFYPYSLGTLLMTSVFCIFSQTATNIVLAEERNSKAEIVELFPDVKPGFSKATHRIHSAIREKLGRGETIPLRGIGPLPQSESNVDAKLPCERTVYLYPREVYYGDTIYIAVCYRNISEDDGKRVTRLNRNEWDDKLNNVSATLRFKNEELKYLFEKDGSFKGTRNAHHERTTFFGPNDFFVGYVCCIETPPLEDLKQSFWQEIRNELEKESSISLAIDIELPAGFSFSKDLISETVTINNRPNSELGLLEKWSYEYASPSDPFYPEIHKRGNKDFSYKLRPSSSDESKYSIIYQKEKATPLSVSPSYVVRVGNRKPFAPNSPTTVDGWRELEDRFVDSTIKDEIHLTTLLIEYYAARETNAENIQDKRDAVLQWLDKLPNAQRIALSLYVGVNFRELQPLLRTIELRREL